VSSPRSESLFLFPPFSLAMSHFLSNNADTLQAVPLRYAFSPFSIHVSSFPTPAFVWSAEIFFRTLLSTLPPPPLRRLTARHGEGAERRFLLQEIVPHRLPVQILFVEVTDFSRCRLPFDFSGGGLLATLNFPADSELVSRGADGPF